MQVLLRVVGSQGSWRPWDRDRVYGHRGLGRWWNMGLSAPPYRRSMGSGGDDTTTHPAKMIQRPSWLFCLLKLHRCGRIGLVLRRKRWTIEHIALIIARLVVPTLSISGQGRMLVNLFRLFALENPVFCDSFILR